MKNSPENSNPMLSLVCCRPALVPFTLECARLCPRPRPPAPRGDWAYAVEETAFHSPPPVQCAQCLSLRRPPRAQHPRACSVAPLLQAARNPSTRPCRGRRQAACGRAGGWGRRWPSPWGYTGAEAPGRNAASGPPKPQGCTRPTLCCL